MQTRHSSTTVILVTFNMFYMTLSETGGARMISVAINCGSFHSLPGLFEVWEVFTPGVNI